MLPGCERDGETHLPNTSSALPARHVVKKLVHHTHFTFMGNSVTRHYAFALRDILESGNDARLNRTEEKGECRGEVGTSSCFLPFTVDGRQQNGLVKFFWKNYIGPLPSYDDHARDVCGMKLTEPCLRELFAEAKDTDILVLGSTPCNTTHFQLIGGNSLAAFRTAGPQHADASIHADHAEIIRMLLRVWPGLIVWHSFPHLRMSLDTSGHVAADWDLNQCYSAIDARLRCATRLFTDRVRFLDLRGVQRLRESEYADFIHHPGALSEVAVAMLFRLLMLEPSPAASQVRAPKSAARSRAAPATAPPTTT